MASSGSRTSTTGRCRSSTRRRTRCGRPSTRGRAPARSRSRRLPVTSGSRSRAWAKCGGSPPPSSLAGVLVASYTERPDLAARTGEIDDVWAEFIHHARLNRHWHRLREDFPDFQLVLYDDQSDAVLGRGHSVPFGWDGSWDDLPDGVEGVFDRLFEEGGRA